MIKLILNLHLTIKITGNLSEIKIQVPLKEQKLSIEQKNRKIFKFHLKLKYKTHHKFDIILI